MSHSAGARAPSSVSPSRCITPWRQYDARPLPFPRRLAEVSGLDNHSTQLYDSVKENRAAGSGQPGSGHSSISEPDGPEADDRDRRRRARAPPGTAPGDPATRAATGPG